jgi:predicted dithiol-disulfide oxidoreductase (DUF899 family)
MNYRETSRRLAEYRHQIGELREKMRSAQAAIEPEEVRDYEFTNASGKVSLSALFGTKDTLIVIHNMGTACPSCTMWADGFNGVFEHVRDRAAFAVSSPDAPEVQQKFAAARGWKFPMVSHQSTAFAMDMGYSWNGEAMPGVSVFKRKAGKILWVADSAFDEGDEFCVVWRLIDLIPEGVAGWRPKFNYPD